jgi:DNA-binding NarL/FixJ family response regulator
MTLRVVVADDQELVRLGLRGIVESAADLQVVGEASTGAQAVDLAQTLHPDVVLMDIRMPEMDGIEATARIAATDAAATTRVLVLTTFDLDEYVYAALRAGASGFLLKDTPPRTLLDAIRAAACGDALLSPAITRKLIAHFTERGAARATGTNTTRRLNVITEREREVLALIAEGMTNAEIASRLHIEAGTAKTHVRHLLTKLDARDRVQLVIIAFRSGLA